MPKLTEQQRAMLRDFRSWAESEGWADWAIEVYDAALARIDELETAPRELLAYRNGITHGEMVEITTRAAPEAHDG